MPFADTQDIRTYHEIRGDGPVLVLIHGAFVDCRMWEPQTEAFSAEYRVLRYDLRGHGRSSPSARRHYSVDVFADDLRDLLLSLSIPRATICGISYGGMVAQAFAARYPELLTGLVLAGTAVSTTLTMSDRLHPYLLAPRWLFLPTIRMLGTRRFVRFSFWLARMTRNRRWFGQDEGVRRYVEETMLRVSTAEYAKIYGAIYDFTAPDLSGVRCPALLLNGEHESGSVHRHAVHLNRLIPHARAGLIPGAGHVANMENPEAFNRYLREFLARIHQQK
jgi:pimeloyl-ACP methyl ester carboxylesterase